MNRQTNGKSVPKNKKSKRLRFKIEKLEERIAPAKGGIPGPGDGGHKCNSYGGHNHSWGSC